MKLSSSPDVTVPGFGLAYLNPMLIRGSEPILVDDL